MGDFLVTSSVRGTARAENELPAGERSTTPTGRRDQGTLQGMGNAASSGCFPSKKRAAEEEEVQPEQAAPSTAIESSPAPPLVMVDIKEKNQLSASSQVKNEWYEFGVDEKVCALLRKAEMEHYIPNFAFHQIEFDTLPCLTVDDLKDMNVNRVGHRRKLLSQFKGIEAA